MTRTQKMLGLVAVFIALALFALTDLCGLTQQTKGSGIGDVGNAASATLKP